MPKSQSHSPSSHSKSAGRNSSDDPPAMSDTAMRKKKNADAQAAFRARRANYIATLEETVTSLESVVVQLQDSCREARNKVAELDRENMRLRRAGTDLWRTLARIRKSGQGPDLHNEDLPPMPACFTSSHPLSASMPASPLDLYPDNGFRYSTGVGQSIPLHNGPYPSGNHVYSGNSAPFGGSEREHVSGDSPTLPFETHRLQKYGSYHPYSMQGGSREAPWPSPVTHTSSSGGDSAPPDSNGSSPGFIESPSLTSTDIPYAPRFSIAEDQKVPLPSIDTTPYIFPGSRSLSPSASSPPSSSSASVNSSSFQFSFPDGDRSEYDFRRLSSGGEVTLHGGTADISSLARPGGDGIRYSLGSRHSNSGPDRQLIPGLPPISKNDHSFLDRESSDGDGEHHNRRVRSRRGGHDGRSASPGVPPMSSTLAVIKAQAFGALRRTRTRTKRSAEGGAKVALEALEARGINMGVSVGKVKRQRLDDDDYDDDMKASP